MKRGIVWLSGSALLTFGLGCGGGAPDQPVAETDPTGPSKDPSEDLSQSGVERLMALDHDLVPGSTGDDVVAVHAHLSRYGYFPNHDLARKYPEWRPLVSEAPAATSIYDQHTVEAVQKYQTYAGIPVTGVVDEETRAQMRMPRCGVPDGLTKADPSQKFAIIKKNWGNSATWMLQASAPVQAHLGASSAMTTWSNATTFSFTEHFNAVDTDIFIGWGILDWGTLGSTSRQDIFSDDITIVINMRYTNWYFGSSPYIPTGQIDFESLILHELGHAMGLDHSGFPNAIMYSGLPGGVSGGVATRDLRIDDKVAISSLYDQWELMDSDTFDVGYGANGDLWVTAASDHTVWKLVDGGWHPAGADASMITVAPNGFPYVIAGWGDGSIWVHPSSDPATGTWQPVPGGGCAKDIAAGPGDFGTNVIWAIGCGGAADTSIWKYSLAGWQRDLSGGLAARIAVDASGIPWVVNAGGGIFQYSNTDPNTGHWIQSSPTPAASDIGVGPHDYPWVIGNGSSIYVWNQQPSGPGNPPAPVRNEWRQLPGAAQRIAVGPNGDPWVVNSSHQLFKTKK